MANGISDAFTIGVILLLIFGAVCFYLYTRIQQTEKRLNLCENILLDLKVAAEHGTNLLHNDAPQFNSFSMNDDTELLSTNDSRDIDVETDDINALYERAIDEAYESSNEIVAEEAADIMIEKVEEEPIDLSIYDSLNVKELKNLAKQHHISGASSMSRSQLIDALAESHIIPSTSEPLSSFISNDDISSNAEPVSFD